MTSGVKDRTRRWKTVREEQRAMIERNPDSSYTKSIVALGAKKAADVELIGNAYSDLACVDLRVWQGDDEFKQAFAAAKDALGALAQIGYDRWFVA